MTHEVSMKNSSKNTGKYINTKHRFFMNYVATCQNITHMRPAYPKKRAYKPKQLLIQAMEPFTNNVVISIQ